MNEDLPLISHNYKNHNDNKRAYMRDIILGINDGLISTVLLTIGIYASGLNKYNIIITIISSSLAGIVSMGLGEYLATKSQLEVTEAELKLEKYHIENNLNVELKQVEEFLKYDLLIQNNNLINSFVKEMSLNKTGLFNFMKKIEFGITDDDYRNPLISMSVSGSLFFIGSFPTILSLILPYNINNCMVICIFFNTIALFSIGAFKTLMTNKNIFSSGLENLLLAAIGGFISFFVGYFIKVL